MDRTCGKNTTDNEVTLTEMLDARERRAMRQDAYLHQYNAPLLCFTMNIAGPVKNTPLIRRGFEEGRRMILEKLAEAGLPILFTAAFNEKTGNEFFIVIDGGSTEVKKIALAIEDSSPLGRLFDMDVLTPNKEHLSRMDLGIAERSCLICGQPAKECSSRRKHSVPELQAKTTAILSEWFDGAVEKTGRLAVQSLLYEACTTPKPGLVDCRSSGSHSDMDLFTFLRSSLALEEYFQTVFRIGRETSLLEPSATFRYIRNAGIEAEKTMFTATAGINTHKGAIFSLGILCAAVGRLHRSLWNDSERILAECAAMTKGITAHDLHGITAENAETPGEIFYVQYGITGIRGQAEAGFPAVLKASLPALEKGLQNGLSINEAGCGALLALLAATDDTNLIRRGGIETQKRIRKESARLIEKDPYPSYAALAAMDDAFIAANLSPGGCADLLALTYFLYFLKEVN